MQTIILKFIALFLVVGIFLVTNCLLPNGIFLLNSSIKSTGYA